MDPRERRDRERLAEIITRCKEMLATASAERRDLNSEEAPHFDGLQTEFDSIAGRLKLPTLRSGGQNLAEQVRAADALLSQPLNGATARYAPAGQSTTGPQQVRAIPRETRLADVRPAGEIGQGLTMAQFVRGIVTGNWRGVDPAVRSMSIGGNGSFIVPTPLALQIIDKARAAAVCFQLGAMTVPMDSAQLTVPVLTGDATAAWKTENSAATDGDMTFGSVVFHAKTLVSICKISIELAEDGQDANGIIDSSIAKSLALQLDLAALRGAGGPGPLGLLNWDNMPKTLLGSGNGATASYDDILNAIQTIALANEAANGIAWSPRTAGTFSKVKDSQNRYMDPPGPVAALQRLSTSSIPTNLTVGTSGDCSEIYIGDWTKLMIGLRDHLVMEVSREAADANSSAFQNGQVWVRGYLRGDVAIARPAAFNILTGTRP